MGVLKKCCGKKIALGEMVGREPGNAHQEANRDWRFMETNQDILYRKGNEHKSGKT
jgi:hypothetical protein